jgi:hypothetical protein
MSPGQPDPALVRRHLLALDAAVRRLRRHRGRPLAALREDPDLQVTAAPRVRPAGGA